MTVCVATLMTSIAAQKSKHISKICYIFCATSRYMFAKNLVLCLYTKAVE